MKYNNLLLPITIASLISCLLPSCTIQKKVHSPGFHVEWLSFKSPGKQCIKRQGDRKEINSSGENNPQKDDRIDNQQILASKEPGYQILQPEFKAPQKKNAGKENDCDLIVMKSGDEISAKVSGNKGQRHKIQKVR